MARKLISSGSAFEKIAGYSRALVDGEWVHVSGTTGFDYAKMTISPDLTEQTRQAFRNIESALEKAGLSLRDVVRVRYYLTRPNTSNALRRCSASIWGRSALPSRRSCAGWSIPG